MVTGLSHLTLAVGDLDRSLGFYTDVLGLRAVARWPRGAYLAAGDLWLALALDPNADPASGETHVALTVAAEDFESVRRRVLASGAAEWRENRSEGPSTYVLDPDGHRIEVHVGTLASRLESFATAPPPGLTVYETPAVAAPAPEASRHHRFDGGPLRREDLDPDPLAQFARWLGEAARAPYGDPYAMTLATAGPGGAPSARTVALKGVDERGFVFTSRYDGPKARDLDANPRAALVFYWPDRGRQVRATGVVERLPDAEAERLFRARPRAAQLALLAFRQSEPVADRAALDERVAAIAREHESGAIPRPAWGGYVVRPDAVELWQGRTDRLHDRFEYRRRGDGRWDLVRLAP